MTLLSYLRDNWDGIPIYFNTIKFNDYFINIIPFMLNNNVVKYEEDRIYNNKGDLFITDNPLLVDKAKMELFEVIVLGGNEGLEVDKGIRLITDGKKQIIKQSQDEDIDIFEPMKLSFLLADFGNIPIFNIANFMSPPQLKKPFIPTEAPPPPPQLKKQFIPTEAPPPPPQLKKPFIPTEAPPPPPQLKKPFIPTEAPPPPPQLKKPFIPTEAPPPPPQLKKPFVEKKKSDILNPPIIPEDLEVKGKNLKLLNDKLFGGTKIRVLQKVIKELPYEEIVYAGPDSGMAQIAIGAVAKKYGKKATMFVNTSLKVRMLPPLVEFGKNHLGIKYDFSKDPKGRSLYDTNEDAKKYVSGDPQKRILLPFGLKDENTITEFAEILREAVKDMPQPKRMWMVAGSGMLLEVFHRIWPNTKYMVVQVGKNVDPASLLHNGVKDELFVAPERFKDMAEIEPPYETLSWYDAKLWRFVLQGAQEGDYIWNVATFPDLSGLHRFLIGDVYTRTIQYDEKGEPMYYPSSPYFDPSRPGVEIKGYYSSVFENNDNIPPSPTVALMKLNKDFEDFSLDEKPKFIPTQDPPPPPPLRKEQPPSEREQKSIEKPKSRFPFVPFVKTGMLETKENKDEFKQAKMIKMENNEYDYFPKRNKEYMYTDVSLYSSADVSHSLKTAELISKYYDISNKTLTEASACIGGNSWSFADKVKNINLVEIDKNNFKALKHNMSVVFNKDLGSFNKDVNNNSLEYKPGNTMSFFNDNYIKIRDKLGGDIIFYDPPWGGVDYKNEPQVGYSYEGKFYNLEDMSKKSFYKVPPELIVFRIPISSIIVNNDYKYETTVVFNDLYGKAIYKLVFLSDIKGNELPGDVKVKRINYKKIEYEVL